MSTNPLAIARDVARPVKNFIRRNRYALAVVGAGIAVLSTLKSWTPLADRGEPQDTLAARARLGETKMKTKRRRSRRGLAPGHYTLATLRNVSLVTKRYLAKADQAQRGRQAERSKIGSALDNQYRSTLSDGEIQNIRLSRLSDEGIQFHTS